MGYLDAIRDITIADIKVDLMRTAYDNEDALLNKFDPRVVLIWSAVFVIVPWFFYEPAPLFAMLVASLLLAYLRLSLGAMGGFVLSSPHSGQSRASTSISAPQPERSRQ